MAKTSKSEELNDTNNQKCKCCDKELIGGGNNYDDNLHL